MNKPEFLYHASSDPDILEFQPQNESPRYNGDVNLVFATPHPGIAAMFLAPKDIPIEISIYSDRYVTFISSTRKEYMLKDKGGAIYSLPVDTFETDIKTGMGAIEWFSKVPVRPISKEIFQTSIDAMEKYKVDMYFVSNAILKQIHADPANALDLVK